MAEQQPTHIRYRAPGIRPISAIGDRAPKILALVNYDIGVMDEVDVAGETATEFVPVGKARRVEHTFAVTDETLAAFRAGGLSEPVTAFVGSLVHFMDAELRALAKERGLERLSGQKSRKAHGLDHVRVLTLYDADGPSGETATPNIKRPRLERGGRGYPH